MYHYFDQHQTEVHNIWWPLLLLLLHIFIPDSWIWVNQSDIQTLLFLLAAEDRITNNCKASSSCCPLHQNDQSVVTLSQLHSPSLGRSLRFNLRLQRHGHLNFNCSRQMVCPSNARCGPAKRSTQMRPCKFKVCVWNNPNYYRWPRII